MSFFDFSSTKTRYYHHGRMRVEGGILPDAITAYRTYGDLKNPCVVFPTCYGGGLDHQGYLIGPDKTFDPEKYFIVTFGLFSGGESSSPSNTPAPYNGPYFPNVSYQDNTRAQYAVLKHLGVQKVHVAIGFSMGGQQAYFWAVMYPDFVEHYVCNCGSARTSDHNKCFIEGPKSALLASKDFDNGHYSSPPQHGLRAFARVYCGWAYGQTWFREKLYLMDGKYPDLSTFMRGEWEASHLSWDANDLVTLFHTWQTGDISQVRDDGDLAKCLGSITARGLIMPSKTDLYFPPEDSEYEVSCMPNTAKLVVIPSVWGHFAGAGSNKKDFQFVRDEVTKFLKESEAQALAQAQAQT
ncbi:homoserine acetyltransferase [Macrolepiota fuliginosa MF-IS2]|uniref:Homoserine acetyltransferase n=1 Tax=Macrolepiota fuliginosa MF-IS2 TaxID=1400762 RepID=A0A9P5XCM3_9AGAR|nr:homoserine acetyltransferase [Macrolepiota fuliginosa MF-IS2]